MLPGPENAWVQLCGRHRVVVNPCRPDACLCCVGPLRHAPEQYSGGRRTPRSVSTDAGVKPAPHWTQWWVWSASACSAAIIVPRTGRARRAAIPASDSRAMRWAERFPRGRWSRHSRSEADAAKHSLPCATENQIVQYGSIGATAVAPGASPAEERREIFQQPAPDFIVAQTDWPGRPDRGDRRSKVARSKSL